MQTLLYTIAPVGAVVVGAAGAIAKRPSDAFVSAMQHLAAGVVFAAAATEILPQVVHGASAWATVIGGGAGVAAMLGIKQIEERATGSVAMLAAVGIDILVDGLVLGLAFIAGGKAGLLLTFALTLEVLFVGVSVALELSEEMRSRLRILAVVTGLALLLPLGVLVAAPVSALPPIIVTGFLSFGLMALLYLVTEELLVEAHEKPDSPLITSMFFIGFLGLLVIEEMVG